MGCDLIIGMALESEKRGKPKLRFVDYIKDIVGIGIAGIAREAED